MTDRVDTAPSSTDDLLGTHSAPAEPVPFEKDTDSAGSAVSTASAFAADAAAACAQALQGLSRESEAARANAQPLADEQPRTRETKTGAAPASPQREEASSAQKVPSFLVNAAEAVAPPVIPSAAETAQGSAQAPEPAPAATTDAPVFDDDYEPIVTPEEKPQAEADPVDADAAAGAAAGAATRTTADNEQPPAAPVFDDNYEPILPHESAEDDASAAAAEADGNAAGPSPEDTAEIDVAAVEAKLQDPGSTISFEPITDELIDTDRTYDAGTNMQLRWGARSDVGKVRSHNEDSYLVQSPLFCVCDGMGGHAAGEVASRIAVETIAKTAPHSADPALLASAIEAANAAIIEAAKNGLGKAGMGCTATAAYIEGEQIAIAHVGDSRAYLLHEKNLIRVTNDHSFVEELVAAGEITADEARVHPNRSVITRALGSDPAMYADHFLLPIAAGDRLILCSDGLSSMIPDSEIERVANQSSTAQICTDNLVDAALAAGGGDNVTVVVADVVDDGKERAFKRKRRRNVLVGVFVVLAVMLAAVAAGALFIKNSVYLGVCDGNVAVYQGVPNKIFDIELHQLVDETSIPLKDLPQDTQHRLEAGIAQADRDEAEGTIAKYRKQIDEEQQRQAQVAEALKRGSQAPEAPSVPGAQTGDQVAQEALNLSQETAPTAAPAPAPAPDPNQPAPTGGDAHE